MGFTAFKIKSNSFLIKGSLLAFYYFSSYSQTDHLEAAQRLLPFDTIFLILQLIHLLFSERTYSLEHSKLRLFYKDNLLIGRPVYWFFRIFFLLINKFQLTFINLLNIQYSPWFLRRFLTSNSLTKPTNTLRCSTDLYLIIDEGEVGLELTSTVDMVGIVFSMTWCILGALGISMNSGRAYELYKLSSFGGPFWRCWTFARKMFTYDLNSPE